ncbi:GNAT family N-acetyltransferase [Oceanobacillus sp. M65]|uniref:GNAT family N-acetyltransferase n=1 Tax=Oceanobacillus jordanicus TaxID=2867266 RepID=A0AAW5B2K3_9BACI|nr:GNAT family N-acetyltransferase [Oceanobacillus jordanicus]MCG3418626.1 GNAT family N-acetyltransferase [Oceanobacillus jordanicus]
METVIRLMEEEDIPLVQNVARTSWKATYKGIIPETVQRNFINMAYRDEMMQRRMKASFLYVAEISNEIVGFANFSRVKEKGEVELSAIYLLPKVQGKGIGSALLAKGIHELKGATELFINVEENNELGKSFYIAKGFQVHSTFDEELDGHILKTVRMVKEIHRI